FIVWLPGICVKSKRGQALGRRRAAAIAPGDPPQFALDGAGAAEQTPVERFEIVARGIEHETARHPDGDADGAAVELDCETLAQHDLKFSNARRRAAADAGEGGVEARLLRNRMRSRGLASVAHWEGPGLAPAGMRRPGALGSCRAAARMNF